jgi:cytidine deaminase
MTPRERVFRRMTASASAVSSFPPPPEHLAKLAREAAERGSYSPYSKFRVGAAIATDAGDFWGANVENASYGLANCAERSAIFHAVNMGAQRVSQCVVYTPTRDVLASPCGACRQVLREFCGGDPASLTVWSFNAGGAVKAWTLAELLPDSFGPEALAAD